MIGITYWKHCVQAVSTESKGTDVLSVLRSTNYFSGVILKILSNIGYLSFSTKI